MKREIKNVSDLTKVKVLVNMKCLGYAGKCVKHLPRNVRDKMFDELEADGLLDSNLNPTEKARPIILANLSLVEV